MIGMLHQLSASIHGLSLYSAETTTCFIYCDVLLFSKIVYFYLSLETYTYGPHIAVLFFKGQELVLIYGTYMHGIKQWKPLQHLKEHKVK